MILHAAYCIVGRMSAAISWLEGGLLCKKSQCGGNILVLNHCLDLVMPSVHVYSHALYSVHVYSHDLYSVHVYSTVKSCVL